MGTPIRSRLQAVPVLLWMVLTALVLRLIVVFFIYRDLPYAEEYLSHPQFGWEMGWIARSLASGHGFCSPYFYWSGATAMQPPLFPFLLAGIFRSGRGLARCSEGLA